VSRDKDAPEGARYFRLLYEHCGVMWWDDWDCIVNDECPVCRKEIEPYEVQDL